MWQSDPKLRKAANTAEHSRHIFPDKKRVGLANRVTGRMESHNSEYGVKVANFSRYLAESNFGLVITGTSLFNSKTYDEQGRRRDFAWKMQKISISMCSNGYGHRLLFLAHDSASVAARMFRNPSATPNILPVDSNGGMNVPSCISGIHAKQPGFQTLGIFLQDFDKILVGGVLKDAGRAIANFQRISVELGIPGKPIEIAYKFAMDWETSRLISTKEWMLLTHKFSSLKRACAPSL